jgi:hypothetical protein
MTEEEAKTKSCCGPVGCGKRGRNDYSDYLNNPSGPEERQAAIIAAAADAPRTCIGSACMAWRWYPDNRQDFTGWEEHRIGWCGLAGKP